MGLTPGGSITATLTHKQYTEYKKTSSVYDCTVEDVEYICNSNSTLVDWACYDGARAGVTVALWGTRWRHRLSLQTPQHNETIDVFYIKTKHT